MDFASDANNQPCCSKSLKNEPSNNNRLKTDEIIDLDDEDSCDSAYETGSALSRSTLSSPTTDLKEIKSSENGPKHRRKKLYYYANVHYERNIVAPWPLCMYKHESSASNSSNTIVISDSDDDDALTSKQPKTLNSTMNSSVSASEVINLDSSDDETEHIKYHIVETDGNTRKIPDYYMANAFQPDPNAQLRPKTRVVARRKGEHLPTSYIRGGGISCLYHNDDSAFYAGIISSKSYQEDGCWHYLIFFDDGHVQYVPSDQIRVVFGNYGTKYVHENAQRFFDYYFNGVKKSKLFELEFQVDQKARVYSDGRVEVAQVVSSKPALVLLHFLKSNHAEWLYTGSPRFELIWKSIIKEDRLRRYHQVNVTLIEVSSDSEDEEDDFKSPQKQPLPKDAKDPCQKTIMLRPSSLIDNYKPTVNKLVRQHICGRECVREFEENRQIFGFDPLKRPLLAGWQRQITGTCFYTAPCGRSFRTIEAVYKHLLTTKSKLSIDCFTFSTNVECMTEKISYSQSNKNCFLNDLIPGGCREKRQIPVIPIADNLPCFKEYVIQNHRNPRSKKVPAILNHSDNPFRSGCDCKDDCSNKSKCSCWQLTLDGQKKGPSGYRYKRLEGRVDTGIFECNPSCKCSSKCLNRVVKARIEQKLELYETKDRGYGIRCQTDLPKGTFVACYFGDLLHGKTADERAMKQIGSIFGDEYFMQLDLIEVAEQYKDGYESDVSDFGDFGEDVMPLKRFKVDETMKPTPPLTDGTNSVLSYFPDIIKKKVQIEINQRTTLFGENAVEFVVDGRYRGNISRFFNHSCQPNLFSQTVFIDHHDLRFPWLAFFASEDIKAGTELTWDYNYQIGSIEGRQMQCRCGAPECRGRLL